MNGGLLWTFVLTGLVALLFILPMLPALIEYRWPRDVTPLRVVREHDGNVTNFANVFDQYIESRFGKMLPSLGASEICPVRLESGASCILLGRTAEFSLSAAEHAALTVKQLVVGVDAVRLPDNVLFESEVFAGGDFTGGAQSAFRAVLARGKAALVSGSAVLRWIHAGGVLSIANDVQLFGRASSASHIELGIGVEFERLHAPTILFGIAADSVAQSNIFPGPICDWQPKANGEMIGGQWRVKGDVALPPGCAYAVPLVAIGNLRVGAASWLKRALKSNGDLVLGDACQVDDAVVATGKVEIGAGCRIRGPVISETEVLLRRGSVVGTLSNPATVSAPRIVIEAGVMVFGTVWARDNGEVRAAA